MAEEYLWEKPYSDEELTAAKAHAMEIAASAAIAANLPAEEEGPVLEDDPVWNEAVVVEQMSLRNSATFMFHFTDPVAAEMNGYKTEGSAGFDLAAICSNGCSMRLTKGDVTMVRTGTIPVIPEGYFGMLVCRSSAAKNGVTMQPPVAIIDSDYRGEIMLPLTSTRSSGTSISTGERFAQMVLIPASRIPVLEIKHKENIPATARATGGFGHTGV